MGDDLSLLALNASREFGKQVAAHLGLSLTRHEEREFEDGEHKVRPLDNVRGRDVYVVQSLYSDAEQSVNDKLIRLLFFVGALRDASAGRITAVLPYLCYARKDRKTKARDPVATRYLAQTLEATGVDRVVTLDVHNLAAYQNAFRCRSEHLEARRLFANHFAGLVRNEDVTVVSPDVGGVKRAELFRETLGRRLGRAVGSAFMEKQRSEGVVSGDAVVGDVADSVALVIDDLIASGTTIARAVRACKERGARRVYAAAAHGLFVGRANEVLADPLLDRLAVTNTVPPFRLRPELVSERLAIVDAAPLFAEAIRRLHEGGSLVELTEDGGT